MVTVNMSLLHEVPYSHAKYVFVHAPMITL